MSETATIPMKRYMQLLRDEEKFWKKLNNAKYVGLYYKDGGLSRMVVLKESEALQALEVSTNNQIQLLIDQREQMVQDNRTLQSKLNRINGYLVATICILLTIIIFLCYHLV